MTPLQRPPRSFSPTRYRRPDNLALVPGSALPYKEDWHEMANELPPNSVLVVLPDHNPTQKQTLLAIAKLLAGEGHQLRVVAEAELARPPQYVQDRLPIP